MAICRSTFLLALFAALAGTAPLRAQEISFRAAAGAAVPVGGAGDRRDAGPSAMLSVETGLSRLWSIRLDGEWSQLTGPPAPEGQEHFSNYQDLRTIGMSLNGVLRFSDGPLAPYLLAGIGAYRLQRVNGPPSPYGTTGALQGASASTATSGGGLTRSWRPGRWCTSRTTARPSSPRPSTGRSSSAFGFGSHERCG